MHALYRAYLLLSLFSAFSTRAHAVQGESPRQQLFKALTKNDTAEVKKVISENTLDPNLLFPPHNETALHIALKRGDMNTATVLLSLGADPTRVSHLGDIPLIMAIKRGEHRFVGIALRNNTQQKQQTQSGNAIRGGINPLVTKGLFELAKTPKVTTHDAKLLLGLLVEHGADLKALDEQGLAPIHHAVLSNRPRAFVRELIADGADINQKTKDGRSALHFAAQVGDNTMMQFLLENKADVNAQSLEGWVPLHYAKNADSAHLLIKHKADLAVKREGKTLTEIITTKAVRNAVKKSIEKQKQHTSAIS